MEFDAGLELAEAAYAAVRWGEAQPDVIAYQVERLDAATRELAAILEGLPPIPGWDTSVVERARLRTSDGPTQQWGLSIAGNEATVHGKTYVLDDGPAAFVKALVNAGPGVWIAGREMGPRVQPQPDCVFKRLPGPIKAAIESETGKGYRIRPE